MTGRRDGWPKVGERCVWLLPADALFALAAFEPEQLHFGASSEPPSPLLSVQFSLCGKDPRVPLGLGHIVALHHRAPNSHRIHERIWCF